jgi:hypothetical protein
VPLAVAKERGLVEDIISVDAVLRARKPVELGGRLVDTAGGGVDLDAADGGDLHLGVYSKLACWALVARFHVAVRQSTVCEMRKFGMVTRR